MDLPNSEIVAEVTVIGTGGGYGESIVIHFGFNEWIVVDSCINPLTKISLPLEYLNELGVNLANDVKMIICTHWHNDHIHGISQLLEVCKRAKFCISRATDVKKFLRYVQLDYEKAKYSTTASSTTEINRCLQILERRKGIIKQAQKDCLIYGTTFQNSIRCELFSLSPSDYIVSEFDKELSTLMKEYGGSNRKVVYQSPNDKSIVLFVKLNSHRAILGSDLEYSVDKRKGWLNILEESLSIHKRSSYFKVPHHGAESGYTKLIWDELLLDTPLSTLTPWNIRDKLPKLSMLSKLLQHTDNLHITSKYSGAKAKRREKSLKKAISEFNPTLKEIKFEKGIIQSRINLLDINSYWTVSHFGEALKVDQNFIKLKQREKSS